MRILLAISLSLLVSCGCGQRSEEGRPSYDPFRAITEADYQDFGKLRIDDQVLEPRRQRVTDRLVEVRPSVRMSLMGGSPENNALDDEILYNPTSIDISMDEKLAFVADEGRMQVRVFNIGAGRFVGEIGYGPGTGPGEFRELRDIELAATGSVHIFDSQLRRISTFSLDGILENEIVVEFESGSLAQSEDRYALQSQLNKSHVFHLIGSDGSTLRSFGNFARHPILNIGMSGHVVSTPGGFAWVGLHAGQLVGFDTDGNVRFYRNTLHATPPPNVTGRAADRPEGPVIGRVPLNADYEAIYVSVIDTTLSEPIVDAYSLQDGRYLYSIPNPHPQDDECFISYVTAKHVYTVCTAAGTLSQWARVMPDDGKRETVRRNDRTNQPAPARPVNSDR